MLNRNGYRTRQGQTFVAGVHKILTNTVYIKQVAVQRDILSNSAAKAEC